MEDHSLAQEEAEETLDRGEVAPLWRDGVGLPVPGLRLGQTPGVGDEVLLPGSPGHLSP